MALYRTYADALASVSTHDDGAFIDALADETRDGDHTRYEVVDGALVFALNIDRWRTDLASSAAGKGAAMIRASRRVPTEITTHTAELALSAVSVSVLEFWESVADRSGAVTDWDWTPAIQAAIDAAGFGQSVNFPDIGGWYSFTEITVKAGVNFVARGRSLRGGVIKFGQTQSQMVNTTFAMMWMKGVTFDYSAAAYGTSPRLAPNNLLLFRCLLDGTNLENTGSTAGNAITLAGIAWDLHLIGSYIWNYSGWGVYIDASDETTGYLASGVFTTLQTSKIANCATGGVRVYGAASDSTDLHLSQVLIDHCGIGLSLDNPRASGQGELTVFGQGVRIELCSTQAIYNSGATVDIQGLWCFGGASGASTTHYIHNVSGLMTIAGRIACSIYNEDGQTCIVDGLAAGGAMRNISKRVIVKGDASSKGSDYKILRFRVTKGEASGSITVALVDGDGRSPGSYGLSVDTSAEIAASGSATVGAGSSAITYARTSDGHVLLITLPWKIADTFSANVMETNVGVHPMLVSRTSGTPGAYIVSTFKLNTGSAFSLSMLPYSTSTTGDGAQPFLVFEVGAMFEY